MRLLVAALLTFMAWNAYLAVSHLTRMQEIAALTLESSTTQENISAVVRDLTDMETGQRGYLLTGDSSYLQPYSEAKGRIAADLALLRKGFANRAQRERSLESEIESLAASKQDEMDRSISMRQEGYRHRAFMLVASNEGMEYMNKARGLLSSLSAEETSSFVQLQRNRKESLRMALAETIVTNTCLLALTVCLIGVNRYRFKVLEQQAILSKQELGMRDLQLGKLLSTLSNQARFKATAIEANACLLLENYGGFLPRQGHAYAEQIKEASAQMERLRQDLVTSPGYKNDANAA